MNYGQINPLTNIWLFQNNTSFLTTSVELVLTLQAISNGFSLQVQRIPSCFRHVARLASLLSSGQFLSNHSSPLGRVQTWYLLRLVRPMAVSHIVVALIKKSYTEFQKSSLPVPFAGFVANATYFHKYVTKVAYEYH